MEEKMFSKFMAVGLYVRDFKKSLAFYKETLGMEAETEDMENQFAQLKIGSTSVALLNDATIEGMCGKQYIGSHDPKQNFVLAVEVNSVEEAVGKLEKEGVEIVVPPKSTPWGQKVAYFKDVNGYIWELSEPFEE